jgi:hypothetical protein
MSKVEMVRIDDSNCFGLPIEYDNTGIRINNISIDENILPESSYIFHGPRKVDISIRVPEGTTVIADITEL